MKKRSNTDSNDAYGDDEQLWAFHSAIEDGIELPCDAFVIGEPGRPGKIAERNDAMKALKVHEKKARRGVTPEWGMETA